MFGNGDFSLRIEPRSRSKNIRPFAAIITAIFIIKFVWEVGILALKLISPKGYLTKFAFSCFFWKQSKVSSTFTLRLLTGLLLDLTSSIIGLVLFGGLYMVLEADANRRTEKYPALFKNLWTSLLLNLTAFAIIACELGAAQAYMPPTEQSWRTFPVFWLVPMCGFIYMAHIKDDRSRRSICCPKRNAHGMKYMQPGEIQLIDLI